MNSESKALLDLAAFTRLNIQSKRLCLFGNSEEYFGGVSNVRLGQQGHIHNFVETKHQYHVFILSKLPKYKSKKNGFTHYGKQNHKCACCGRQFVLNNNHTKTDSLKALVKNALKERVSLRAICRIFSVSMNRLKEFARNLWQQTPRDIGIGKTEIKKVKNLQVFGIQADELWSFVCKKKSKRWIWVAYDPVNRLVLAHHIGNRGTKSAKKFWKKIPGELKSCQFETDDWQAYKHIIPEKQHKIGKDLTYYIEGFNATIRARVSRLVRKTLSFSKKDKWHHLAIAWFFWQFNLERQPYI